MALLGKDELQMPLLSFNRSVFLVGFCSTPRPIFHGHRTQLRAHSELDDLWAPPSHQNNHYHAPDLKQIEPCLNVKTASQTEIGRQIAKKFIPISYSVTQNLPRNHAQTWTAKPNQSRTASESNKDQSQIWVIGRVNKLVFSRYQWEAWSSKIS